MGRRRPTRVLLVDDHEPVREAVATLLGDRGYDVRTAEDPLHAEALLAAGFLPDVIVTDLFGPGVRDLSLAELEPMRRAAPAVPIVVVSAREGVAALLAGASGPVAAALPKPAPFDALVACLERVCPRPARASAGR